MPADTHFVFVSFAYCKSVIHDFLNYIFRTKERVFPAPGIAFNLIGRLILHRWLRVSGERFMTLN